MGPDNEPIYVPRESITVKFNTDKMIDNNSGSVSYVLRTDESFAELRKNLKNFNKSLMTSINTNRVLELIYKNNLF